VATAVSDRSACRIREKYNLSNVCPCKELPVQTEGENAAEDGITELSF